MVRGCQDYQVAAFAWVKDNYKYFTNAAGTVYQGNGQPLSKWSGDYTPLGYVKLKKSSANSVVTTGNSCYSIERAEFGVYNNASASDNSKVGTLKTNANGESNILTLNAGTYYVKELKAPKGYALDAQIKKITVASGTTTTVSFADQPQMDTIDVLVRKVDADTDKSKPQGNATLKGAEFTVTMEIIKPIQQKQEKIRYELGCLKLIRMECVNMIRSIKCQEMICI